MSATSGFLQDLEYLHNFERGDDYRLKTETSVTAQVTTIVSLKASFIWRRVGQPPPGFIRDDTLLSAAFIFSL